MEYTKLGRTGLDVSRICLGCMSYGGGNLGNHAWSLPEEESRPFIKKALEAGINFFDTANRYSLDNSLRRLGMDYVHLYQTHRFDHDTPIEETLEVLHDVVKAGKARYIGASS